MVRAFYIIGLLLLTSLQYRLWFLPGGIVSTWQLKSAIAAQESQNILLGQRNTELVREITQWKQGGRIVEAHARYDLGMIKKNEIFYQWNTSREQEPAE